MMPKTMKKLVSIRPVPESALTDSAALNEFIRLDESAIPRPGKGQVLIKVSRVTLNPNDRYHILGTYIGTPHVPYPRPLGFEGAGIVVSSGGGIVGRMRVGKRVAFYSLGALSEYVVCDALNVFIPRDDVDFATAARSVANPMTAIMMLEEAKRVGSRCILNTAGASALGRLLIRLGKKQGIDVIPIVRRTEQENICRQEGASSVFNSNDQDFDDQLKKFTQQNNCNYAFDCIGGAMPGKLLNALPDDGTVSLYGYLDSSPISFAPQSLFCQRSIVSFEINAELSRASLLQKLFMVRRITQGMGKEFHSDLQANFPISEASSAYAYYSNNMTAGKVQIVLNENI